MSGVSRERKSEVIDTIRDKLSRSVIAMATDYRGLSVAEMTRLRQALSEAGIEYRVVKNTLARLAAERADKQGLRELLVGPTAIAFGYGEEVEAAKALVDYIRVSKVDLRIKGGLLGKRLLRPEELSTLAFLPPRQTLLAQLLGGLEAPLSALLGVLTANLCGLAQVLRGRIQQLEGGQDVAA